MSANELIKKLRARKVCKDGIRRQPQKHEREAADLLESQAAEIERLREAMVAGDYLIDRLDALSLKKPVRDLCEARAAYQLAKVRAEAAQALKGTGADHG